jgi:hypothetical protein
LKSSGDKASPCFKPLWIGKLSDKYLLMQTFAEATYKNKGSSGGKVSKVAPVLN